MLPTSVAAPHLLRIKTKTISGLLRGRSQGGNFVIRRAKTKYYYSTILAHHVRADVFIFIPHTSKRRREF